jgi:hypothetical protein
VKKSRGKVATLKFATPKAIAKIQQGQSSVVRSGKFCILQIKSKIDRVNVVDNIEPEVKELESVSAIEEVEEKAELEILIAQIEDEVVPEKVEEQKTEENKNLESKPEKYEEEEKVVEKEKIVVIESQPEEVPTVEASSEAYYVKLTFV